MVEVAIGCENDCALNTRDSGNPEVILPHASTQFPAFHIEPCIRVDHDVGGDVCNRKLSKQFIERQLLVGAQLN